MSINFAAMSDWISSHTRTGPIAVITHRNGDMDTIASGIVLASAIGKNAKACGIYVGSLAQKILDGMVIDYQQIDQNRPALPRKLAGIIVVDCASPSQIGFKLPDVPLCIVDHHSAASDNWPEGALELKGDYSSTAEMVWDWFQSKSLEINPDQGTLLLSAIISDTGRFKHSRPGCHRRVDEICKASGIDIVDVIEKVESEDLNHSQRISIHKAVSRSTVHEVGEFIVSITRAGTNEGLVAHALLAAGAHASFVYKKNSSDLRLSSRASRTATNQGIHLGELMKKIADRLGGDGGGHAGAAGWSGTSDEIELKSVLLATLSSELIQ